MREGHTSFQIRCQHMQHPFHGGKSKLNSIFFAKKMRKGICELKTCKKVISELLMRCS